MQAWHTRWGGALAIALGTSRGAWAAEPVLVHADAETAEAAAVRVAASGTWNVQSWTAFRQGHAARVTGDATLDPCAGARSSAAEVARHQGRAEGSLNYLEYETALGHLRAADRAAGCAADPVDAGTLARTAYLEGAVRFGMGDAPAAQRAWRAALGFDPTFQWDPNIAPTGRPAFDELRANLTYEAPGHLTVHPAATTRLTLDGVPVTGAEVELPAGRHLLQSQGVRLDTAWVQVAPGGRAQVWLPGQLPDDLEGLLATETGRAALGPLLGVVDAEHPVTVVAGKQAWTTVDGQAWSRVAQVQRRSRAQRVRRTIAWSASGAMLLGAGASYAVAYDAHASYVAQDTPLSDVAALRDRTNRAFLAAAGLAAGAVVSALAGVP